MEALTAFFIESGAAYPCGPAIFWHNTGFPIQGSGLASCSEEPIGFAFRDEEAGSASDGARLGIGRA